MAISKRDTEFVSLFVLMVPEARIELAPSQGGLDFESSASTNFTTPASPWLYKQIRFSCQ